MSNSCSVRLPERVLMSAATSLPLGDGSIASKLTLRGTSKTWRSSPSLAMVQIVSSEATKTRCTAPRGANSSEIELGVAAGMGVAWGGGVATTTVGNDCDVVVALALVGAGLFANCGPASSSAHPTRSTAASMTTSANDKLVKRSIDSSHAEQEERGLSKVRGMVIPLHRLARLALPILIEFTPPNAPFRTGNVASAS